MYFQEKFHSLIKLTHTESMFSACSVQWTFPSIYHFHLVFSNTNWKYNFPPSSVIFTRVWWYRVMNSLDDIWRRWQVLFVIIGSTQHPDHTMTTTQTSTRIKQEVCNYFSSNSLYFMQSVERSILSSPVHLS